MISHFNYMLLICATLVCVFLYNVKYDSQQAERELASLSREIAAEREEARLLEAEWALRTEPQRLQRLASHHLEMAPVRAEQIVSLEDLPMIEPEAPAGIEEPAPQPEPALMATAEAPAVVMSMGLAVSESRHADAGAVLSGAGGR